VREHFLTYDSHNKSALINDSIGHPVVDRIFLANRKLCIG
jgi:hypothetical protein